MNEDPGHDPTVPTTPVEATDPTEPVSTSEPTEAVPAATEPETAGAQDPPNLPPRPPASEPLRRRSIAVPMWAALALAALLVLGIGFLGGYAVGSEDGHGGREGHRSAREDNRESDTSGASDGSGRQGSLGTLPPRRLVPPTLGPRGGDGGQVPRRPQPANPTGAFLGVSVRDSTDPQGATVIQVAPAGPAGAGGLKAGDVITEVDGAPVKSAAALTASVRSQQPGTKVVVKYTRAGASATADVTLGDRAQLRAQ